MHPRLAKIRAELLEGSTPWEDGPSVVEMQKRHNKFLVKYAQEQEEKGNCERAVQVSGHVISRFPFSNT